MAINLMTCARTHGAGGGGEYSTWSDEANNHRLGKICAGAHQQTFYASVFREYRLLKRKSA